jgi:hypothetical protein
VVEQGNAGIDLTDDHGSATWHYGVGSICMTEPGTAILDSLEPVRLVGSADVERTGVRVLPDGMGTGGPGAMPVTYVPIAGFRIDQSCERDGHVVELAVQVRRQHRGAGGFQGLRLRYHVGDDSFEATNEFSIVLCDPSAHEAQLNGILAACREKARSDRLPDAADA